jgi:hypothetical protein
MDDFGKIIKASSMATKMLIEWFPMDIINIILDFTFNLEKRRYNNIAFLKYKYMGETPLSKLCYKCYDKHVTTECSSCEKMMCINCMYKCPKSYRFYCDKHNCNDCQIKCKSSPLSKLNKKIAELGIDIHAYDKYTIFNYNLSNYMILHNDPIEVPIIKMFRNFGIPLTGEIFS